MGWNGSGIFVPDNGWVGHSQLGLGWMPDKHHNWMAYSIHMDGGYYKRISEFAHLWRNEPVHVIVDTGRSTLANVIVNAPSRTLKVVLARNWGIRTHTRICSTPNCFDKGVTDGGIGYGPFRIVWHRHSPWKKRMNCQLWVHDWSWRKAALNSHGNGVEPDAGRQICEWRANMKEMMWWLMMPGGKNDWFWYVDC